MKVIALTGRAGSGKDTAAFMLQLLTTRTHLKSLDESDMVEFLEGYSRHSFSELNVNSQGDPALAHFHIHKFAWPVYRIVGILLNRDPDEIMRDPTFKNKIQAWGLTGRQLLQKVGTECFRDVISTEVWIDIMRERLKAPAPGVVISDCRFPNEGEFLKKECDSFIIHLHGRDSGTATEHRSESNIENVPADVSIPNTGSYIDLLNQLSNVCSYLGILKCQYTWK